MDWKEVLGAQYVWVFDEVDVMGLPFSFVWEGQRRLPTVVADKERVSMMIADLAVA